MRTVEQDFFQPVAGVNYPNDQANTRTPSSSNSPDPIPKAGNDAAFAEHENDARQAVRGERGGGEGEGGGEHEDLLHGDLSWPRAARARGGGV